jgi:hypothetical protein
MRVSCLLAGLSLMLLSISVQHASAQMAQHVNKLKPFTTDGCSVWIDGTVTDPYLWRHCCVAHDKAYWIGGTNLERNKADEAILACVSDVAGKAMGSYMYFFVSTGGGPFLITPYRWGYGWDFLEQGRPRGYKVPTAAEWDQINALLPLAEKTIAEDAVKHPALIKPTKK